MLLCLIQTWSGVPHPDLVGGTWGTSHHPDLVGGTQGVPGVPLPSRPGWGYPIQTWSGVPQVPPTIQTRLVGTPSRPGMGGYLGYPHHPDLVRGTPCTPHHSDLGWGTPRPEMGYPSPGLRWGTPPRPGMGYPYLDLRWGTPHLDLGMGTPYLDLGWGTPLPRPEMGYPPT